MDLSIIIPVFNRSALLAHCLQSIEKATDNYINLHFEIIIIDDGSDKEDIENFIRTRTNKCLTRYFFKSNEGAPSARNLGLKHARGKYILLLDSDDLIEADFFEKKVETLERDNSLAGVYGPWEHFRGNTEFQENLIIPRHTYFPLDQKPSPQEQLKRLLGGWYIPSHAILWKRQVLITLNGQNESLKINQDVDLVFRALCNGNKIKGVSGGRSLIRDHDNVRVGKIGSSSEKLKQILDLRKYFASELQERNLWDNEMAEALSRFCFNYWVSHRKQFPQQANEFLQFANDLYPGLNVVGSKPFEWMGKLLGKERAVIVKEYFNRYK